MHTNGQVLWITLLLGLAGNRAWGAERDMILTASAGMSNGTVVRFRTFSEPPGLSLAATAWDSAVSVRGNTAHRFLVDSKKGLYFGYDVQVDPVVGRAEFLVAIRPLSMRWEELRSRRGATVLSLVQPRSYPGIQSVGGGDRISVTVLVNNATGQTIVDEIQVSSAARPPADTVESQASRRDYTLDDVQLRLVRPTLHINGTAAREWPNLNLTGSIFWFTLLDQSRVVLSLTPHLGYDFKKEGYIASDTLVVTLNSVEYKVQSAETILPGSWNLYVFHDRSPLAPGTANPEAIIFGVANSVESLLPRQ